MSKNRSIKTLPLDGGCVCFDFVNTVHSRVENDRHDYINSYLEFIEWMGKLRLLPSERLTKLKKIAKNKNRSAEKAIEEIRQKRELLYNFFSPVIKNKTPDRTSISNFNKGLSSSLSSLVFNYSKGKLVLGWNEKEPDLYEPLNIIFKDAFDIIMNIPQNRFKECKACGWLFIDKSKNNSRTWCSMQTCGSIEKSKRYYYRKKKGE